MTRFLLIACGILITSVSNTFGQSGTQHPGNNHARQEKVEKLKIAYLTRRLDLSSEQARAFWPVYNAYQKAYRQLTAAQRRARLAQGSPQEATAAQARQQLEADFDYQQKVLDLRKKYNREFLKILPPQKVVILYRAERDFYNRLLKELRQRGEQKK
ncbi:hypothetical protein [Compostibacter hankyongensis]|uniref:Periplasmic heavy metal sensor n=1 Tax=Compostibacter hankyongensis TaxID=1007089 RepID=A0ABP8FEI5_9BACT